MPARANILIPESKLLRLDATTALHPACRGCTRRPGGRPQDLAGGRLSQPQPEPLFSTDIWFSGSDSNQVLESGVLGQHLEGRPGFRGLPQRRPAPSVPSIQIGSTSTRAAAGQVAGVGMAISDRSPVYAFQPDGIDVRPTHRGHELTFIRQMASQTTSTAMP
ncbi:MAG: hypothetical protein IPN71_13105 [Fibrobacteres bacterium]|nr:hypothetical protein [Fibrobacterota bacterium]